VHASQQAAVVEKQAVVDVFLPSDSARFPVEENTARATVTPPSDR
jgi:hypothetical protein